MKKALLDLVTSKKFLTALTAIIVYVAGRSGFDVDTAMLDRIYGALLVCAQGIADNGKSAAQVAAGAAVASAGPAPITVGHRARTALSGPDRGPMQHAAAPRAPRLSHQGGGTAAQRRSPA